MNRNILFVDDDELFMKGIQRRYSDKFSFTCATSGQEALEILKENDNFEIIISDYYMPGINGIEFLKNAELINNKAIKVLITGYADLNMAIDAVNKGNVFRIICKPFPFDLMAKVIEDCLKQYRLNHIERDEKIKSEIISVLSHEIRTPITAINNNLFLIKKVIDEKNYNKVTEFMERIEGINARLVMSVDKIDFLSRLLSGHHVIRKSNVNLINDVLKPLMSDYTKFKGNPDFNIIFNSNFNDYIVFSDRTSLHQIILELIDNAYKFSNGEEIYIDLSDDEKNVIVTIKDSGIGVSENFEKLAELFYQEDKGSSRMFTGNGLGLTLVKKLCEINKIKIEYSKNDPRGTIVSLILKK